MIFKCYAAPALEGTNPRSNVELRNEKKEK
jgi:hypothetical protein